MRTIEYCLSFVTKKNSVCCEHVLKKEKIGIYFQWKFDEDLVDIARERKFVKNVEVVSWKSQRRLVAVEVGKRKWKK